MHTKIIQNTKFVYILYTKIIQQIKILYDNECTKSVHQIPTYIPKMYKVQTKNDMKLDVCFLYKQCSNYTKCIQMLME